MIELTRINELPIIVNAELIEFVEKTPDTLVSLTTGKKLMVRESVEEVVQKVTDFKRSIVSFPKIAA